MEGRRLLQFFLRMIILVAVVLEDEVVLELHLLVIGSFEHLILLRVLLLLLREHVVVSIRDGRRIGELIIAAAAHHLILLRLSVVVIVALRSGLVERLRAC